MVRNERWKELKKERERERKVGGRGNKGGKERGK